MTPSQTRERRIYLIRCSYFMRGCTADIASVMRKMGFIGVIPAEIERIWGDEIADDNPLFCQARPVDGFPESPALELRQLLSRMAA
jgi:hypothetical protein